MVGAGPPTWPMVSPPFLPFGAQVNAYLTCNNQANHVISLPAVYITYQTLRVSTCSYVDPSNSGHVFNQSMYEYGPCVAAAYLVG